jgi:hypothetical protein
MGHALRKALGVIAAVQGWGQAAGTAMMADLAGAPALAGSSLKAALDLDWDDPAARDQALAEVLGLLDRVEGFIAGQAGDQVAAAAVATARQVRDQDIDLTGPAPVLRRGVAKDRRISVEDAEMRHGRKSRSALCGHLHKAERDVRPVKVQQRASGGTWRTIVGLADFAVVRSYLSTTGKWAIDALDALTALFTTGPWLPPAAAPP